MTAVTNGTTAATNGTTTSPSRTTTTSRRARAWEPIGSFQSAEGATRAVSHLVEQDHEVAGVAIAPTGYVEADRPRLRDRIGATAPRAAAWAAAAAAAITIGASTGLDALVGFVLPVVAVAAVVGALIGAVRALREHRRERLHRIPGQPARLRPTAFDVVVDHGAPSARHQLARWWDPAAPPVQRAG